MLHMVNYYWRDRKKKTHKKWDRKILLKFWWIIPGCKFKTQIFKSW